MHGRIRPMSILLISLLLLGVVAAACQQAARGDVGLQKARLENVETKIARVSGVATKLDTQLSSLQTKDEGMAGEVSALRTSLEELRVAIDGLKKDIAGAKSADASLTKKLDDLSSKLGGIDQRLWVLESRYNDHLRKYHGGG